jgi:hydroxyethylthiazole kinase-like uncharacterized protein yjeF
MHSKLTALYTPAQTQSVDRYAIDNLGFKGAALMSRAGHVAFNLIGTRWPEARNIVIFCGGGNNGGDGYVVAALAQEAGLQVELRYLVNPERLKGDAHSAFEWAERAGVSMIPFQASELIVADLIVDALLGTGLSGEIHSDYFKAIVEINRSQIPVLAIDIPSGLNGDSGAVMGIAVEASATITFIGIKRGMLTAAGLSCCGEIVFDTLQLPDEAFRNIQPVAELLHINSFLPRPKRRQDSHKGDYGHLLIVAGNRGMGGAALLTAEAAARMGVGLISVATHCDNVMAIQVAVPEIMTHAIERAEELEPLLERASAVVIGPGLGGDPWAEALFRATLRRDIPLLIDADGLNLLARMGPPLAEESDPLSQQLNPQQWVLTPHTGEAARLLELTPQEIESNRFEAAERLAEKYSATVVLKGAGTLVLSQGFTPAVCSHGNPGMASGGMGDLLAGVIGALMAQGEELNEAAQYGVALHSAAADYYVAEHGEWGVLASDLVPIINHLLNFGAFDGPFHSD